MMAILNDARIQIIDERAEPGKRRPLMKASEEKASCLPPPPAKDPAGRLDSAKAAPAAALDRVLEAQGILTSGLFRDERKAILMVQHVLKQAKDAAYAELTVGDIARHKEAKEAALLEGYSARPAADIRTADEWEEEG